MKSYTATLNPPEIDKFFSEVDRLTQILDKEGIDYVRSPEGFGLCIKHKKFKGEIAYTGDGKMLITIFSKPFYVPYSKVSNEIKKYLFLDELEEVT